MLKVFRIFRLSNLIKNANLQKEHKAILKICKLVFYLCLYLHLIACCLWIVLGWGSGARYYRDTHRNGYFDYLGNAFTDEQGQELQADSRYDMMFGESSTFKSESWERYTVNDLPDFEERNYYWES